MSESVVFDRDMYSPGDWVTARFHISGPYPGRTRNIILSLESGEITEVTYEETDWDDDGSYTTTSTSTETFYYNVQEITISPSIDHHEIEIRFQLPAVWQFPIKTEMIEVFHRAHIKYDIKLGSDKHVFLDIPYDVGKLPISNPEKYEFDDVRINLDSNIALSNQSIQLGLTTNKPGKFRSIRIELQEHGSARAHGYSDSYSTKLDEWKIYSIDEFPINLEFDSYGSSSCSGKNYDISHSLNVIIDKKLAMDPHYDMEIKYFDTASPMNYLG